MGAGKGKRKGGGGKGEGVVAGREEICVMGFGGCTPLSRYRPYLPLSSTTGIRITDQRVGPYSIFTDYRCSMELAGKNMLTFIQYNTESCGRCNDDQ